MDGDSDITGEGKTRVTPRLENLATAGPEAVIGEIAGVTEAVKTDLNAYGNSRRLLSDLAISSSRSGASVVRPAAGEVSSFTHPARRSQRSAAWSPRPGALGFPSVVSSDGDEGSHEGGQTGR